MRWRWLLVEPPSFPPITGLEYACAGSAERGHRVLLAHPERCPAFHHDRRMLEGLVHGGVITSLTAGSLVGRFGESVRRFALQLVRDGWPTTSRLTRTITPGARRGWRRSSSTPV